MPKLDEAVQLSTSDEDNGDDLLSSLSAFLKSKGHTNLSGERLLDLIGRAKLGEFEGLAIEARMSSRDALRFARSLTGQQTKDGRSTVPEMGRMISQHSTAAITRQLLRTPDARKFAHELLAIFAKEASSKLASNRLLFLRYPTIDGELLQRRFEQCLAGKEIFDELQKSGNLSRARTLLSTLSLSQEKKEKEVKKIFAAGKQSDVISYFS